MVVVLVDNCISPDCYFFNTYSHWHILIYDDEYTYSVVKITTRFVGSGFSGLGGFTSLLFICLILSVVDIDSMVVISCDENIIFF